LQLIETLRDSIVTYMYRDMKILLELWTNCFGFKN